MKNLRLFAAALIFGLIGCASSKEPHETVVAAPVAVAAVATPTPAPEPAATPEPPKLGKWEQHFADRVAKFRAENAALPTGSHPIVFFGDSITEGFPLGDLFPDWLTVNRGVVSDVISRPPSLPQTMGLMNRLQPSVFDAHPRVVSLLIGTNHMPGENMNADRLIESYAKLLDAIRAGVPDAAIIVNTVPPAGNARKDRDTMNKNIVAFNERLRALAADRQLEVVDLYALLVDETGALKDDYTRDGVHFTRPAYTVWADALRPKLQPFAETAPKAGQP